MSGVYEFMLPLLFCHLLPLLLAASYQPNCPDTFDCGYLHNISFPFTVTQRQDCGLLPLRNCDHPEKPMIQLETNGTWFQIVQLLPSLTTSDRILQFRDTYIYGLLQNESCDAFRNNYTLPHTFPFVSFSIPYYVTMFRCNRSLHVTPPTTILSYTKCPDYNLYYNYSKSMTGHDEPPSSLRACTKLHLPIKDVPDAKNPFTFLTADIYTRVELTKECADCHYRQGGQCQLNNTQKFCCANAVPKKSSHLEAKLLIGLGIGVPCLLVIGLLFLLLLYKRKHASSGGHLDSRDSYSDSCSDRHQQSSSEYFGVPLFSYAQLKEATSNFDRTKELGDGGFGTVYHGKLSDGREVAVKRLYEHNYRREEQFMNEVRILTRLRHKHLVSLYGCTSRHSRELLLVYEYISNGTVACHLHGGLARPGLLPWSTRMKIAIETASALAYLHASDIIHRDVKTNNILLDNNYCVKVADFGLSRDFPHHVTHLSTAPQGTPGYLDPEYYNCYQLTSKSDVYSFGVVLIELISSMPAVDMNRSRDEINLSNLAVKKIQECAIGELVDPSLGFEWDSGVKGMVVSVAGLALQCLQKEKDLRPSMGEVLNELVRIGSGKDVVEVNVDGCGVSHSCAHSPPPPASPEWDEAGLLMNMKPTSPNSVTVNWESECTTPNVSG